jgi:hypothetical protein
MMPLREGRRRTVTPKHTVEDLMVSVYFSADTCKTSILVSKHAIHILEYINHFGQNVKCASVFFLERDRRRKLLWREIKG